MGGDRTPEPLPSQGRGWGEEWTPPHNNCEHRNNITSKCQPSHRKHINCHNHYTPNNTRENQANPL